MTNIITSAIEALKLTWMADIADQLTALHNIYGFPDISPDPATDAQPLILRDYTGANNESDVLWFDQFYEDVELLQKCANIHSIRNGFAVTSYNSNLKFAEYYDEARVMISDWLSHHAWDTYCCTH